MPKGKYMRKIITMFALVLALPSVAQAQVAPPSVNAQAAYQVITANNYLLHDKFAPYIVGYALTHQVNTDKCEAYWPVINGRKIYPNTLEVQAYCSDSHTLSMINLTPFDLAWIYANIPVYHNTGVFPGN